MKKTLVKVLSIMLAAALCWPALAQAAQKKPNILVI